MKYYVNVTNRLEKTDLKISHGFIVIKKDKKWQFLNENRWKLYPGVPTKDQLFDLGTRLETATMFKSKHHATFVAKMYNTKTRMASVYKAVVVEIE